jgi:hypothetical protein
MLLETISRHDGEKQIKLVCIEDLKNKGKSLGQVHSVPALLILPEKNLLFGKHVFDYLLLPGRGKLVAGNTGNTNEQKKVEGDIAQTGQSASEPVNLEPSAFNMGRGYGDNYSMIDDEQCNSTGENFKLYMWTSLDNAPNDIMSENVVMNAESRAKKEIPDINEFKARRDFELNQKDLNTNNMPPTISGRT